MSASQFPINQATPVHGGESFAPASELCHVAQQLLRAELWLGLALDPRMPDESRRVLFTQACETLAYLVLYTNPWNTAAEVQPQA